MARCVPRGCAAVGMRCLLLLLTKVVVPPAAAAGTRPGALILAAAAGRGPWQQRRQLHRRHLPLAGGRLRQHSHRLRGLLHMRCRRHGRRRGRGGVRCRHLCIPTKVIDDGAVVLRLSDMLRQLVAVRGRCCVVLGGGRGAHQPARRRRCQGVAGRAVSGPMGRPPPPGCCIAPTNAGQGVGGAHSRLQVKGVRRAHLGGCGLGARLAVLRHAAPPRSRAAECGIAPLAWLRPSGLALLGPLASAS